MAGLVFRCCTDRRRAALRGNPALNGIDFLEVDDLQPAELDPDEAAEFAALPIGERDRLLWQRRLTVAFVNPLLAAHKAALAPPDKPVHLRLIGGERPDRRDIGVTVLSVGADRAVLRTSVAGDFSVYRLQLVAGPGDDAAPAGFDPVLAAVDFSFKVDCPADQDCRTDEPCPPTERPQVDLDYLARDYATFRRLMLDRISVLSPGWRERHAADLGVAMVELVAYVADHLAYRQDAIATEAYLGTARRRVSVRRHARLVDYPMHDGTNARAWVQVQVDPGAPPTGTPLPQVDPVTGVRTRFLTRIDAAGPVVADGELAALLAAHRPEVFEPLEAVTLFPQHASLDLYPWGESECCLPAGATRATLAGHVDTLKVGDVVVFEEVRGPETGQPGDADPAHRCAVRLTEVTLSSDPLGGRYLEPPTNAAADVTEIAWSRADALPFPVCVSATVPGDGGVLAPTVVSVARGNIVLVDHGRTLTEPLPEAVPAPTLERVTAGGRACADDADRPAIPPRFRPILDQGPVSQAAAYDPAASAAAAMRWPVGSALPQAFLESGVTPDRWNARRDLLALGPGVRAFVVEVESDGSAQLRFGDGTNGLRPTPGLTFQATYRVGNGSRGNVGRDAIAHVVTDVGGVTGARNPLPASGGVDPETVEDVRRFAPVAFRTQERAVTADDYAAMAERHPQVQQAAAQFRWTGSWRTAFVTVDPLGGPAAEGDFNPVLVDQLEPYRMAGHDLEVDGPRYVPLEIEMTACVKKPYFRSDIRRALLDVFSSRMLPDGRRGVFHPDNFTFGQPVYLSPLYAAAYGVEGVESVTISRFGRQGGTKDPRPIEDGRLDLGRLEIAQLDNSASFPERGVFRLTVSGGK